MIAADHLAGLINQPLDQVCQNGELLAEGLIKAKELYNPDLLIVFADIAVEAEAMGVVLEYSADRNPHTVTYPDVRDVKVIDLSITGRLPEMFKAAWICRNSTDVPLFISMKDPFSLAAMIAGSENFLIMLLEEPQTAHKLLDISCESQCMLIDRICSEGFTPLVGAPISSGSLIGARWFRDFAQSYLERILDRINKTNTHKCMHVCGEVSPLIDQLPLLNLDLLSFEEWYAPLWDKMPDTIPMGYVPTDLFAHGTVESVRDASIECINTLPQPFILSTACDLPANADPELVKCFMKTI